AKLDAIAQQRLCASRSEAIRRLIRRPHHHPLALWWLEGPNEKCALARTRFGGRLMPITDDQLDHPCINYGPEAERIRSLGALQFRSTLVCAEMVEAAVAKDPPWMLRTCVRLREFILDSFNPHFGCDSADILALLDAHAARLHRVVARRSCHDHRRSS